MRTKYISASTIIFLLLGSLASYGQEKQNAFSDSILIPSQSISISSAETQAPPTINDMEDETDPNVEFFLLKLRKWAVDPSSRMVGKRTATLLAKNPLWLEVDIAPSVELTENSVNNISADRLNYHNDSSVEQTHEIDWSEEHDTTITFTFTAGQSISSSTKVNFKIPFEGGIEENLTVSLDFSEGSTKTETYKKLLSDKSPIQVPAMSDVSAFVYIQEGQLGGTWRVKKTLRLNSVGVEEFRKVTSQPKTDLTDPDFGVSEVVTSEISGAISGSMGLNVKVDVESTPLIK